jgi:hypothetical protein
VAEGWIGSARRPSSSSSTSRPATRICLATSLAAFTKRAGRTTTRGTDPAFPCRGKCT